MISESVNRVWIEEKDPGGVTVALACRYQIWLAGWLVICTLKSKRLQRLGKMHIRNTRQQPPMFKHCLFVPLEWFVMVVQILNKQLSKFIDENRSLTRCIVPRVQEAFISRVLKRRIFGSITRNSNSRSWKMHKTLPKTTEYLRSSEIFTWSFKPYFWAEEALE